MSISIANDLGSKQDRQDRSSCCEDPLALCRILIATKTKEILYEGYSLIKGYLTQADKKSF